MSTHMYLLAAQIDLEPVEKLALMCLAENANQRDRLAYPGIEPLLTWTGRGKSQVAVVLRHLQELELIYQVSRGYRGRRASFLVFPDGCCGAHPPIARKGPVTPDANEAVQPPVTPEPIDTDCGLSGPPDAVGGKASGPAAESIRSHAQQNASGPPDASPRTLSPQGSIPGSHLPAFPHQRPTVEQHERDPAGDCEHDSARYLCAICRASPARIAS